MSEPTTPLPDEIRDWLLANVLPAEQTEQTSEETFELTEGTPVTFERAGDVLHVSVPATIEAEAQLREAFGFSSEQIGDRAGTVAGFLYVRQKHVDDQPLSLFKISRPALLHQIL